MHLKKKECFCFFMQHTAQDGVEQGLQFGKFLTLGCSDIVHYYRTSTLSNHWRYLSFDFSPPTQCLKVTKKVLYFTTYKIRLFYLTFLAHVICLFVIQEIEKQVHHIFAQFSNTVVLARVLKCNKPTNCSSDDLLKGAEQAFKCWKCRNERNVQSLMKKCPYLENVQLQTINTATGCL